MENDDGETGSSLSVAFELPRSVLQNLSFELYVEKDYSHRIQGANLPRRFETKRDTVPCGALRDECVQKMGHSLARLLVRSLAPHTRSLAPLAHSFCLRAHSFTHSPTRSLESGDVRTSLMRRYKQIPLWAESVSNRRI